jgi:hypothetical protein
LQLYDGVIYIEESTPVKPALMHGIATQPEPDRVAAVAEVTGMGTQNLTLFIHELLLCHIEND